ncbi:MAG: extracellular solute-binding protein [Succinivibrio sp.]
MKKLTTLLGALVLATISFQSVAETLVVWEDEAKGHGIKKAISQFEKENGVSVKLIESTPYVDHINTYKKALKNGTELPDILMLPADRLGAAALEKLIVPINFMQQDQKDYLEKSINAFTYNSQIYACPRSVETMVVYYNQDLLKYPFETMEDYYNFSSSMKSKGKWGIYGKWDNVYFAYGFLKGYGGYVFGNNGTNPNDIGLNNSGAVEGIKYLQHFVQNVFPQEVLGDDGWGVLTKLFTSGKAAAIITGPWELEGIAASGLNYGVAPLPKLPNGNYMCPFLGFRGYAITKDCKNRELAEKLLRYLNQEQNALQRYTLIEEIPPLTKVLENPLIKNDDFANAVAVQALNAEPMPSIPEMASVWVPMNDALSDIMKGKAGVQDALNRAVLKIKHDITPKAEPKPEPKVNVEPEENNSTDDDFVEESNEDNASDDDVE